MRQEVFRFAPSPNGRLHLGHACSALLNAQAARESGGRLLLRIEDIDQPRCPRHLAAAVFEDLAWLGLCWEEPVRFQSGHFADYQARQASLAGMGLLYPCFCSRKTLAAAAGPRDPDGQPLYPGTCRNLSETGRAARIAAGEPHALRLDMAAAAAGPVAWQEAGEGTVRFDPAQWGDVILARRDIGTSYHIAVVVDDALQGVTQVIRGRDLYAATAVHRVLQGLLGLPAPRYRHHRIIETAGRKLSKSAGDTSLAALRAAGLSAADVRRQLGF